MSQTWTGQSRPWLARVAVAAGIAAMLVILWTAFLYLSANNFRPDKAALGLTVVRVLAVALCLFFAWVLLRIVKANVPNTMVLTDDELTVRHGDEAHSIKLKDVDAVVYVMTSVQSGAGLFIYPREEYLAETGSRVKYGDADPALTVSLQRFTDQDERAAALALRDKIKAVGGRFGTSTGPAEATDEDLNVTRTGGGRLRIAKPVIRRADRP